jgi:hypothetical protein
MAGSGALFPRVLLAAESGTPSTCHHPLAKRDTSRKTPTTAVGIGLCASHNRQSGCANAATSASSSTSHHSNKKHKVAANYNHAAPDRDAPARGL